MPGVADVQRKTKLSQDQQRRRRDMDDLIQMVRDGRLHEADERQLETLRLATELQKALVGSGNTGNNAEVIDAVKQAVADALSGLSSGIITTSQEQELRARPKMRHISSELSQKEEKLEISHDDALSKEEKSAEDGADKLKRLREIKGN